MKYVTMKIIFVKRMPLNPIIFVGYQMICMKLKMSYFKSMILNKISEVE